MSVNNIYWLWLESDVLALKTVDIHFERSFTVLETQIALL